MTSAKLIIKRSIKSVASAAKSRTAFLATAPDSVNVIAYHRVVADIEKAEKDSIYGLVVSTATFRKHCELLRKSYTVVSLETARYFLDSGRKLTRPLAAITFDDGYLDFYEEAFPVLNEFGLPATVFLPTNFIGQNKPLAHDRIYWLVRQAMEKNIPLKDTLARTGIRTEIVKEFVSPRNLLKLTDLLVYLPDDLREKTILEMEKEIGDKFEEYPPEYQLLNWEMVREMARKGINFGAHTANHVVLPLENETAMKTEIFESKKTLEMQLGNKVISFAYPNGEYNTAVKETVTYAGFQVAVTTEKRINRPGEDLFALGRTSLCEESTRGIKGNYSPQVANLRFGI